MIVIFPSTFEYWHNFVFFPSLEYFSMFASFPPSYCQINGNNYYPLFILIFNVLTENRNIFNVKLTAGYQNRTRLYYDSSNLSIFSLFFLLKLSQYMSQSTVESSRRSRETETWWEFFSLLGSSVSRWVSSNATQMWYNRYHIPKHRLLQKLHWNPQSYNTFNIKHISNSFWTNSIFYRKKTGEGKEN